MRIHKVLVVVGILASVSVYSSGKVPYRSSSDNGQTGSAPNWKLLERSAPITLTSNGKKVIATREVVCTDQDVDTGQCDGSGYLFIFQLQSTSTNVSVQIGKLLPGFSDAGVMECNNDQNDGNTDELCTNDTTPPSLANLINEMTATPNTKKSPTSVTFVIPDFPAFPEKGFPEEGQGLTIYVVVQQTQPSPLTYPTIGIF
jgi:hypothetical protein